MSLRSLTALVGLWLAVSPATASGQDAWSDPFPGVRYLHRATGTPWRIHAAFVDLCAPGVSIAATRPGERGRTTSAHGSATGAAIAVNGDFFHGGYRPHGLAIGGGERWGDTADPASIHGVLAMGLGRVYISPEGELLDPPPPWISDAVGYHPELVMDGRIVNTDSGGGDPVCVRNPRTAVGVTYEQSTLILVVVDGRQPGHSVGMTCAELASLMLELGAHHAVGLDGGGSSAMWMAGRGVVNRPSDGGERVVANHLTVHASGSGFYPSCPRAVDLVLRADGLSGYTLSAYGRLEPFGVFAAPPPAHPDVPTGGAYALGQAMALRDDGVSGYVLDVLGTLHAFGGAPPIDVARDGWPDGVLARALALRADGSSGWIVDARGGFHPFGGAPAVDSPAPFTGGEVRDVALRSDGASGYVLTASGRLHPFGGAADPGFDPALGDLARSLVLSFDGESGYVLDAAGRVHPFGAAVEVGTTDARFSAYYGSAAVLRPDGVSGFMVDVAGRLHGFGNARSARAAAVAPGGGHVLDAWGGIQPFGDAPDLNVEPGWPAWDIARAFALLPDGRGGVLLDGWGGVHAFGAGATPGPGAYWEGMDVARAIALRADGTSGYVVHAEGGIHPFGDAPPVGEGAVPVVQGARDIALRSSGSSGWVLDGTGALRPFGDAPPAASGLSTSSDVARAVALRTDETSGWVVDGTGALHAFGDAPEVSIAETWPGWDVARDVIVETDSSGSVLDVYGRLHPFSAGGPRGDGGVAPGVDGGVPGSGPGGGADPRADGYVDGGCSIASTRAPPLPPLALCALVVAAVARRRTSRAGIGIVPRRGRGARSGGAAVDR